MKRQAIKMLLQILIFGFLGFIVAKIYHCHWYAVNKKCHESCKAQGFAAGEEESDYEHTVCACFKRTPSDPKRFVLEMTDKLEDGK